jgi:2-oxoglutarate dehydrogenase E1 component
MRLPFRKPLIVIAPKKLLRFRGACSDIEEFSGNSCWQNLIKDQNPKLVAPEKVRKVIICCGQVYFDLEAEREKSGKNDIAILRTESLCPFPFKEIIEELKKYKNAEVVWAQEEPKNAGPWTYVQPRLRNINNFLGKQNSKIGYAGRPIMAATAVGFTSSHNKQLADLIAQAFK